MPDPDLISTADLRHELLKLVADPDVVPTYRVLADRQRDGLWPIVRVNGRPYTRRPDLPLVAAAIGLELKSIKPSARRARAAA